MKQHIHIFGASGSGTTTIAEEVCKKIKYRHYDSDRYFWLPTAEPYTVIRDRGDCIRLMTEDLRPEDRWILSGSIAGWADEFLPLFDLVVFVYVPQDLRIEWLKKREIERYGSRISPGGARYDNSQEFIEWASMYDTGNGNGRSLSKHEDWLKKVACPVVRLINYDLKESVETVVSAIRKAACIKE